MPEHFSPLPYADADAPENLHDTSLDLHWRSHGSGDPIVFLHGYGGNTSTWDPWLAALSPRFRCITLDLKGFGRSPAPDDGRWSLPDLAEPVTRLIVEEGLERVTLVGHSLGGAVALLVALDLLDRERAGEPRRLERLVSVAGAAFPQAPPPFVRFARWTILAPLLFGLAPKKALVRAVYQTIVVQKTAITRKRVAMYAVPLRRPEVRKAALAIACKLEDPELAALTTRYPEIDVPALCLWGRQDSVVPLSVGERLAAALPRAELEVFDACGHMVAEEWPEVSVRRLLAFIEGTRR